MQISETLIREIAAGRLADGARLQPERDMAEDLGISVGTLRKALDDLTEKGLLDRVQGSGNYVRAQAVDQSIYAFFRLEKLAGGGLPSAIVLALDHLPVPDDLPTTRKGETAARIRRLRFLDDEPVAIEEIWLDADGSGGLRGAELSESLYLTYRRTLDLGIERTEDRIGVSACPDWAPAAFDVPCGGACGYVERHGWAGDLGIVEYSHTWFDNTRARYVSRSR